MEETIVLDNEIMICQEPEFETCRKLESTVSYFILCKKGQNIIGSIDAYEIFIAGEKVVSWVARACENAKILEVFDNSNDLKAVIPYLTNSEYTVILNGNIPLLSKQSLKNILQYVMRRNMNACKLKGGYIFKTEYLADVGEVLSVDTYNLRTNDFFKVENFETLEYAKKEIAKRVFAYHSKNGVNFEDLSNTKIDANTQIGFGANVLANSQVLCDSKVGESALIGRNSIIMQSQIGSDCKISDGVVIKNSIISANVKIGDGAYVENCKIGVGCEILEGARLKDSQIDMGTKIAEFVDITKSKLREGVSVGAFARLFCANVEPNYEIFDGKVIISKQEEK